MPPIKQVAGYPKDEPLLSGRALVGNARVAEQGQESTSPADEQVQMRTGNRRSFRLAAQAMNPPQGRKKDNSADGEDEESAVDGVPPASFAQPAEELPSPLEVSKTALSTVRPESIGQPEPSALPNPTTIAAKGDQSSAGINRTKGNGNTKAYPGKFFKKVFYIDPTSRLMNGRAWTEESDFLHWHLRETKKLSHKKCAEYMYPHDAGACQNRWQRMKEVHTALEGEERDAAIGERVRIGNLFAAGHYDYRKALWEESEREKAANGGKKVKMVLKGNRHSEAAPKVKRQKTEQEKTVQEGGRVVAQGAEMGHEEKRPFERVQAWEEGDDEGENEH